MFGSIALAAFAMKFSLALILISLGQLFSASSDFAVSELIFVSGVVAGGFSVCVYSDFKKISAAISIFTMCFALFLLYSACSTDYDFAAFA